MFWSKIWMFIVAAAAAVALTVALLLPRPAQRERVDEERQRLVVACDVVAIQLRDSARVQVDVAGAFARQPAVVTTLDKASGADAIDESRAKAARELAADTIAEVQGTRPDFAILIDRRGRVVARAGIDEREFGDTLAGRWLVDDALAGFLRDDLWFSDDRLWRVAASPVINGPTYVGAVVVGNAITKEYAESLMRPLGAKIAFYADGRSVAASSTVAIDKVADILDRMVAAGANLVTGINFTIDAPSKLLDQTRADAMADARRKAEIYARSAGMKLGHALSIAEGHVARPLVRTLAAREASMPVAAGEEKLTLTVTVSFALLP